MLTKEAAQHVIYEIMKLYPNSVLTMRYQNPFQLMLAVILSAQATDESVAKVSRQLFERYPNPQAVIESSPEEIESYIRTVGLFRNKAKYIYKSSYQLLEEFEGQVPSTRKELQSLTGIGPKSANILLSVAFNQDAFAVDTHVTRVCKHHKIVEENATPKQIEERITEIIPAKYWGRVHQSMFSFGKEICTPRNPKCHEYL
ncbi:DNA-(apurinic or apyrimidinic site) lyase /endonuclease III [Carnobacterium iners]|uniref:Endonuclease III n=1 Tax=Carnobacterium iners TaxID=1073423 RepID=A0A1X7MUP6_9LACT|nr:endonuclease III [Carnobacterium iners]SEL03652.1 DNA-(apurinic or apyrimidinic site) lyase /endonuclease III [Carnobacterium iners]SMH28575.1 DNA-(apurinic or apyrimidinic site) lyase /endonuclease III [Carnobacterium iners]